MQKNFWNDVAEYVKNNRFRSVWRKIAQVLGCVVVFCTTYALILPAITMEQKSYCGLEEHVHTKACYELVEVPSELICNLVEITEIPGDSASGVENLQGENGVVTVSDGDAEKMPLHTHTEECYGVPKELPLTCTLEEGESHTHDFLCHGTWKLVCTQEVHSHALACFSNPEADLETEVVWENMVNHLNLTGIWKEDVVTIAKSQLGYKESTLNYAVNEKADMMGYTRYGAWGRAPYKDWDALFASFCFYYSDVEGMPLGEDCDTWVQDLSEVNLYFDPAEHVPEAGDLLFVDYDGDAKADRVAIISEYIEATEGAAAQVKTIQGNVENQVQSVIYSVDNVQILGYGVLPNQPAPVRSYTYSDQEIWVKVKLPVDTTLPKDAQLVVTEVLQGSSQYDELFSQAEAAVSENVVKAKFYDISFYTAQEQYIPVSDKAKVMMRFVEDVVDAKEKTVVLHYDEADTTPVVIENVSVEEKTVTSDMSFVSCEEPVEYQNTVVTYETEGFSVFGVVEVETGTSSGNGSGSGNGQVNTDTYVTRVPNTSFFDTMYTTIKNAGNEGKIFIIHGNLQYEQNFNLTSVISGEYMDATALSSKENASLNGFNVTSSANQNQLWRLTAGGTEGTYYIQSVDQSGKYLSLVDYQVGENGQNKKVFGLSTTPQLLKIEFDGSNNVMYLSITQGEQAYYLGYDWTPGKFSTFNTRNSNNSVFLSEYTGSLGNSGNQGGGEEPENPQNTEKPVTNLDGKIVMLVAVNNDIDSACDYNKGQVIYAAVASEQSENGLVGSDIGNLSYNNGEVTITENDASNRTVWEFEATGTPGSYYIKAANYFGEPKNDLAGKYLNIASGSLSVTDYKQPIEVVTGIVTEDGDIEEVVCLRVKDGENYYYLRLSGNYGNYDFASSGNSQNTADVRANHFVLAELTSEDKEKVDAVISAIDKLPATKADFDNKFANEPQDNKTSFDNQIAYRTEMRETALAAKEAYDALTSQQKNFVGYERVQKLLNEFDFLWRPEPQIVPATNLNATVKVFNYGANINNNHPLGQNRDFEFYCWDDAEKIVDARLESHNTHEPRMSNVLVNGYPVIQQVGKIRETNDGNGNVSYYTEYVNVNDGRLDYLFDGRYQVGQSMTNGGGLFQLNEDGYYYYYSDTNAAWFDQKSNQFVLYDVVVRPEYTSTEDSEERRSNFLPFNKVLRDSESEDYYVMYDELSVTSSVTKEKVDTAYLNSKTDLWFGMSIEYDFFIPRGRKVNGKDMIFEFHGDDDVFVYIDDVLVLDMGGAHEARDGRINFTTGEVVYETDNGTITKYLSNIFREAGKDVKLDGNTLGDYTMHDLKFFYLERGGTYSYAGIKFNMPALPENTLSVGKDLSVNSSFIDAGLEYTFRLVNANSSTNTVSTESFLKAGEKFDIYNIANNTDTGRDGTIREDGTFTLKAGEMAVFSELMSKVSSGNNEFVLQEIVPDSEKGQYEDIRYSVNGSDPIHLNVQAYSQGGATHGWVANTPTTGMTAYQTDIYTIDRDDADFAHRFDLDNDVDENKLDILRITKKPADGSNIPWDKEFRIQVEVGNDENSLKLLPAGTSYVVDGQTRQVGADGIITLRQWQTATISGFLAGTYWEITEILGEDENYIPTYSGVSLQGFSSITPTGNAGTFGSGDVNFGDTVEFTVTNQVCDALLDIPLSKEAKGNAESATFHFDVERGTWDSNSRTWSTQEKLNGTSITVNNATVTPGVLSLAIKNTDGNRIFYKVSERNTAGDFIYDETFYIVEVEVTNPGSGNVATIVNVWKNGTEQSADPSAALAFVNYRVNQLVVSKEVVNATNPGDLGGTFLFEANIELSGTPFTEIKSGTGYTVENGVIRFTLTHDGSVSIPVPVNGNVTLREINGAGYNTSYQVTQNGMVGSVQNGTTAIVTDMVSDVTIHFTNQCGYELPATGGNGTHLYLIGGLLLSLAAGGLLLKKKRSPM